jgi:thiosulfate reductase cytochrome b subunit
MAAVHQKQPLPNVIFCMFILSQAVLMWHFKLTITYLNRFRTDFAGKSTGLLRKANLYVF